MWIISSVLDEGFPIVHNHVNMAYVFCSCSPASFVCYSPLNFSAHSTYSSTNQNFYSWCFTLIWFCNPVLDNLLTVIGQSTRRQAQIQLWFWSYSSSGGSKLGCTPTENKIRDIQYDIIEFGPFDSFLYSISVWLLGVWHWLTWGSSLCLFQSDAQGGTANLLQRGKHWSAVFLPDTGDQTQSQCGIWFFTQTVRMTLNSF